ncbi:MAG: hypothetical protein ACI38O_03860 [Fibrobacter intestinalis]|uniref:hypothetical protein n=1 Tax=Fibrobacter intestinalis TaxID=28122 RepID=UPI003F107BE1
MGSFRYYDESTGTFEKMFYTTVARDGNLKIVVLNETENQIKPIEKANSPNSIYAIKNKNGAITSINFFGEDKFKTKQIDLKHSHKGMSPHVHEFHGEKYHPTSARPCNEEELAIIKKAQELAK